MDAKKMERLVAATAKLCGKMEALDELEAAEQKPALRGRGRLSWPIPPLAAGLGSDLFRQDLKAMRARVRRLKEESLWSQSYDKAVGLMARAACAVFVRACGVFGAYSPACPRCFLLPMPSTLASPSWWSTRGRRRRASRRQDPSNVETCRCVSK